MENKLGSQHDTAAASDNPTGKHIRGSAVLLAGRVFALGLNVAVQVLAVRYLSKLDYGAFAFGLSAVMLASHLCGLGFTKALPRFTAIYQEQGDYGRMWGGLILMITSSLAIGAAVVFIVLGLNGVIATHLVSNPLSQTMLVVMIALAPINAIDSLLQSAFAVFAGPWTIFFRRYVLAPLLKLTAVLAVTLTGGSVYQLAIGYVLAGAVGVAICSILLYRVLRQQGLLSRFGEQPLVLPAREIYGFGLPLLSSDMVAVLRGTLIVFLLEYFHNSTNVAEFRSVLPIARLNEMVITSFGLLFIPAASRLFAHQDFSKLNELCTRTAVWIMVLTFPLFAATCALAEPLTVLLFGQKYATSGVILALLAVGFYFNAAFGVASRTLKVFGKVRHIVAIDVLATVVGLALSVLLIPAYGALGGAIATCGTMAVHTVLNQLGLWFTTRLRLIHWQSIRVCGLAVLFTLALFQLQRTWTPPLILGLICVALASLLMFVLCKRELDLENSFPQLKRIPLLRWLLGTNGGRESASPASADQPPAGRSTAGSGQRRVLQSHLQDHAASYFPDLDCRGCDVRLVQARERSRSALYEFEIVGQRAKRSVIVKVSANDRLLNSRRTAHDRPRLASLPDPRQKFRFEHAALSAIHEHFGGLNDSRFTTARPLAALEDQRAIILEKVERPTLSRLLNNCTWLGKSAQTANLGEAFQHAGAWLAAYHQIPALRHTRARNRNRTDLTNSLRDYADYLQQVSRASIPDLTSVCHAAQQALPHDLPLGTGHGDFAPRNILVGPANQIAVLDTVSRWQVPVYEDVAGFLVALKASKSQVFGRHWLYDAKQLETYEQRFLLGYFGTAQPPLAAIRLYEIQALLDKWSAQVHSHRVSSRAARVRGSVPLWWRVRFYRRYLQQLLDEIGSGRLMTADGFQSISGNGMKLPKLYLNSQS